MMDSSEDEENLYGAPEVPPSPLKDHSTVLHAGTENTLCSSRRVFSSSYAESEMENELQKMGLEQFYPTKLSPSKVLQIDQRTVTDAAAECSSDLPWCFLRKLMMANVKARNVKCSSGGESTNQSLSMDEDSDLEDVDDSSNEGEKLNALDIITALFLCSDGFVQQEMALKMSLCQFPVPLLLPHCDTKQCTLMLWALRDIVKKYRPQSLSESKGFDEDRMVLSELPLISFVRLGECSLSKSHILNKLLSTTEQNQEAFVHRHMKCGDSPRRISNGLTEITWYLPGGNKNMDVFSEPVAVANLRGDIASFETQYSFLCRTSTAVLVDCFQWDYDMDLVVIDYYTRYVEVVNLTTTTTAYVTGTLKSIFALPEVSDTQIVPCTAAERSQHQDIPAHQ